jgi:hypothetical protein
MLPAVILYIISKSLGVQFKDQIFLLFLLLVNSLLHCVLQLRKLVEFLAL